MKVLLFIHSLGAGGAERVASILANYWAEIGWQVNVVTLAPRDQDAYQLDHTVTRLALNLASDRTSSVGAFTRNLRRVRALRAVIQREKPDVALAMMSVCNVLLALASVGLTRTAQVGSERTYPPQVPLGAVWEWLRARAYRLLDATVVLTREAQEWTCRHTSARRVVVIPNPVAWPLVAQEPVRPPEAVGAPGRKRLLTVGRLGREKCYDRLIQVFRRLTPRFRDWELVIVGDGPEREVLQHTIDRLGLGEVILLPGHVGNIGEWYRRADLYVLTSRFEGFPNALLEAMAHGLPAVSVDCDTGPRDIIRHDVDGLLVAASDDAKLEAALALMMGDANKRSQFATRAVEVRTRFAIERVHEMWIKLFREITA